MIVPLRKDDDLLGDIESVETGSHHLHLWWLGQSGFLVQWGEHRMIFDPYLSDSLTKKYADTDKPHVRMSERVVDPARLDGIELVTSSHHHTDHLDAETLLPLTATNPDLQLVLPEANLGFAKDRLGPSEGPALVPLDTGRSVKVGPFTLHGITAAHNEVEFDENGHSRFLGFVLEAGLFTLYHAGDTLWHESLVSELSLWEIDVALFPINGNRPERRVAGNLNGLEAAALARAINAGVVVPCHYHLFEFNTEEPDEFVAACQRLDQACQVMELGERLSLEFRAE